MTEKRKVQHILNVQWCGHETTLYTVTRYHLGVLEHHDRILVKQCTISCNIYLNTEVKIVKCYWSAELCAGTQSFSQYGIISNHYHYSKTSISLPHTNWHTEARTKTKLDFWVVKAQDHDWEENKWEYSGCKECLCQFSNTITSKKGGRGLNCSCILPSSFGIIDFFFALTNCSTAPLIMQPDFAQEGKEQ